MGNFFMNDSDIKSIQKAVTNRYERNNNTRHCRTNTTNNESTNDVTSGQSNSEPQPSTSKSNEDDKIKTSTPTDKVNIQPQQHEPTPKSKTSAANHNKEKQSPRAKDKSASIQKHSNDVNEPSTSQVNRDKSLCLAKDKRHGAGAGKSVTWHEDIQSPVKSVKFSRCVRKRRTVSDCRETSDYSFGDKETSAGDRTERPVSPNKEKRSHSLCVSEPRTLHHRKLPQYSNEDEENFVDDRAGQTLASYEETQSRSRERSISSYISEPLTAEYYRDGSSYSNTDEEKPLSYRTNQRAAPRPYKEVRSRSSDGSTSSRYTREPLIEEGYQEEYGYSFKDSDSTICEGNGQTVASYEETRPRFMERSTSYYYSCESLIERDQPECFVYSSTTEVNPSRITTNRKLPQIYSLLRDTEPGSPIYIKPAPRRSMNTATDETERKVILEFCHLLEKSKQLFNGLRELPQYGHKQWHSYFGRTFDVYTKLWKFQQQHRTILDTKYGLKRWQIGEIASKIGQLYYHFYLRTSEYAYLNEAFSFYYAIRGRCYYTQASKEDKSELMVKKLRYYARFIVVCLLLKKPKLVRELAKELEKQIYEYGKTYDPEDQAEWNVVMEEVKSFLQAEPVVSVVHPDNYSIVLTNRITPHLTPPVERTPHMTLILQEILVVGSTTHQVKFSEMTMDMYRIIQTFERETSARSSADLPLHDDSPRQRYGGTPSVPTHRGYNIDNGPRYENPHKYLLFRPTASQVLVYLASGMNDLAPNGVLLLYLSADQQMAALKHYEEEVYDNGVPGREHHRDREKGTSTVHRDRKEPQCLHPTDLAPFTRRPLFIIVDSDNSYVFQQVPRPFGQPLVVLMSPSEMPASFLDRKHQGNMLTLFLHSPLAAFTFICEIYTISLAQWDRADSYVDAFMAEASMVISRHRTIDLTYLTFFGDDFLRIILVRYVFCEMTLRMHRAFRGRNMLTRASPPLPEDVLDHPALVHILLDLASYLQVRNHFQEPGATGPPLAKETTYSQ